MEFTRSITIQSKETNIDFIDFLPDYQRANGLFSGGYQILSDIFTKINLWLEQHKNWQVKSCESILYYPNNGFGHRVSSQNTSLGKKCLRGIRCWIVSRDDSCKRPQKIGCVNLVPKINRNALKNKTFESSETIEEMIKRVNETLKIRPIDGRLLSLETLLIPLNENFDINTEDSEYNHKSQYYAQIIRIYFEKGPACYEQIYIENYFPSSISWDNPLAPPIFESLNSLLNKSSPWFNKHSNLRFLSCQTIEIPINKEEALFGSKNFEKNESIISSDNCEYLLKFIRIGYSSISTKVKHNYLSSEISTLRLTQSSEVNMNILSHLTEQNEPNKNKLKIETQATKLDDSLFTLNCKIFVPSRDPMTGYYESISQMRKRIKAWIRVTGARMLYAESSMVKLSYLNSSLLANVDSCLTSTSQFSHSQWIIVFRIYLDKIYHEPPTTVLPFYEKKNLEENFSCIIT